MDLTQLHITGQKLYVKTFMLIVAKALESISKFDAQFKQEIMGYPVGLTIRLGVINGPSLTMLVQPDHSLKDVSNQDIKPDLALKIKHIAHAFLLFTMQEGTAESFVSNRILVDGEVSQAIRFVRVMDRVEVLILPKLIAQFAVKEYPTNTPVLDKVGRAARIYAGVAVGLAKQVIGK